MKLATLAVHAGDRRKLGPHIPVTTPIYAAASFFYEDIGELDRVFADEVRGYCYSRYGNPTRAALEELVSTLEGAHRALACASGMLALEVALQLALVDRPKRVLASDALYGATFKLLDNVLAPFGVETRYVNACDLTQVAAALEEFRPSVVLLETISNPLLRVAPIDRIAELAKTAGTVVIVDNTFATPILVRPFELGVPIVVHSATKYLAGHGDVLGGIVLCDEAHAANLTALERTCGPVLGPFDAYLTMRGIKTLPLRVERQCENARQLADWLRHHPRVERVYFPGLPEHPDRETIQRLLPNGLYGAMVSFELKDAGRDEVFAFLNRLKLIVKATSLGDVHTMVLYPAMSSHRDVPPKQRERMGIRDNLVRISVGIEAIEDVIADLEQALAG